MLWLAQGHRGLAAFDLPKGTEPPSDIMATRESHHQRILKIKNSMWNLFPTNMARIRHASPWEAWLSSLEKQRTDLDQFLFQFSPSLLIIAAISCFVMITWLIQAIHRTARRLQDKGWKQTVAMIVTDLPGIRPIVQKEQAKVVSNLRKDIMKGRGGKRVKTFLTLPEASQGKRTLVKCLEERRKILGDVAYSTRGSQASGAIYMGDKALMDLLNSVYSEYSLANPMHADMFPSVREMEAEVVMMTAGLVGGGGTDSQNVCGSMTSGGTESILTAVKASRDYMAATRGIQHPEMIVAPSAHAAFIKASEYFNIRLVKAQLDGDYCLRGRSVEKHVNRNTIMVVASAPGYPHGVMDDVPSIARVCKRYNIMLHVDACLGGFVLPFLRKMEHFDIPPFDFSVDAVTSMSLDTHKFACSHKGTSVVLYRSPDIRRYQYTTVTDWSGGLYISPGFAGSRSGALIATAWAALLYHGMDGYIENTKRMMACSSMLIDAINNMKNQLKVIGNPIMSVIAFTAVNDPNTNKPVLNIYVVNDIMASKGWKLSALQSPPALHMCFTPAHSESLTQDLIDDLSDAVTEAARRESEGNQDEDQGMAPLYGMAAKVPDRRIVGNFLIAYQDILLEP